MVSSDSTCYSYRLLYVLLLARWFGSMASQVRPGSRLLANEDKVWVSESRTFAFGFTRSDANDGLQLGIWFAELSGDRVVIWSAQRDAPVGKDAILEFDATGNLLLTAGNTTIWTSNTSRSGAMTAAMEETGNFIIYNANLHPIWQSFSHPSDTLLPGQPLTVSSELTTKRTASNSGYYSLKMLQQPTSLSLALSYNLPESYDQNPDSYSNYSYWSGPNISNVTGEVFAVLDNAGSFGIVYGDSSTGAVYIYKNDQDDSGLSMVGNQSVSSSTFRRIILETNGNLRSYRWDNDVNGSRQWVAEWAAVSNPCDIAGICGNGICNLDGSKTNSSCTCLPGTLSKSGDDDECAESSMLTGKCNGRHENLTSSFHIKTMQQTNYYYSRDSMVANYSDIKTVSKCGDACLSDCECVASVYGLDEEKPYCWVLRSLDFGGFQDPSATLFVKVQYNGSASSAGNGASKSDDSDSEPGNSRDKIIVLPIALSMAVLIVLLFLLLHYNVRRQRLLRKTMESSLIFSGAPMNFSYRDLQIRTSNFSHLLGSGGFGSVYKGSLGDGTLIAVKKLERVLPHGKKEFITEVNTIGSMHHMNLVRLCGYSSEGQHRLLVYEFMKNGSLDRWIFSSNCCKEKILDWPTRYNIALGTAQGIAYFHEQCRNRIIHCDIKPENILLDENFCPKVSDFGLAKLMGREHSHVVTMVRGTRGYLAPEWISNRPITVKADVYSYGMLLLEIVGGRRNLDMSFDAESFFFPSWAYKEMTSGEPVKVADKRLGGAIDEEELLRVLKVAFWCVQDEVSIRPSMGEVVKMLAGSPEINPPPIPQAVLDVIEEGLEHVYKAMKRELGHSSSFTINGDPSSRATCSYSTMSPR
ncbi:hypothetical protein Nepgr_010773 [Nepenthes gracilis]|uniref:Receptor-like serine/threonine-protein kinase n=1 Tax=Nepenthes gracilis TaxID=150966 RepID=A0AAD3SD13_NEPGR|nr:hypothetical protein Nepgr_010773 [Nepenthes gracilis]